MREFGRRCAGRHDHVIDIGPRRREHRRTGGAPREDGVRSRRGRRRAASARARRSQQRRVESNRHERGNRVERRADAGVAEIDVVVDAGDERHVQVHPLHRPPAPGCRSRASGRPTEDACRTLHARGAPVDRELRFTVEDHEHLLDDVVEMMADAGGRRMTPRCRKLDAGKARYAAGSGWAIRCASAGRGRALRADAHLRRDHGRSAETRVSLVRPQFIPDG